MGNLDILDVVLMILNTFHKKTLSHNADGPHM